MKRQSFENGFEREQGTWSEPIVGAQGMRRLQMSRLAPWKKTSPNSFSSWITWKIHFTSLAVFHIRFLTPWSWESMNKWLSISKVRVAHLHPNDSLQQLMGLIVFLVFSQCLLHVPQVSAPYTEMTWNPWNLSFRHVLFHEKTHFLILAGGAIYQIWYGRSTDCTYCTGQFTPKMKANANPRLLSSLGG